MLISGQDMDAGVPTIAEVLDLIRRDHRLAYDRRIRLSGSAGDDKTRARSEYHRGKL